MSRPLAYFIAFTCQGARFHGVELGSANEPYSLNATARRIVIESMKEICTRRRWTLIAAQARTSHVHAVVRTDVAPEVVLHAFKAHASRQLNRFEKTGAKRWTRYGSTRYLWKNDGIANAVDFVRARQGQPMTIFLAR